MTLSRSCQRDRHKLRSAYLDTRVGRVDEVRTLLLTCYRGKRKDDVARAEERANLAAVAATRNEPAAPVEPSKTCPNCAEIVKEAARTCRHCGYSFENQPTA